MNTLVELLESVSREFADDTALAITPGIRQQRWTYHQAWDFGGRLAHLLQSRGLQKGDRALIWAPNRPEWVLAYFGCLRAGVILVPLDVRSSTDFVARIIQRTEPKLAFFAKETARDLASLELPATIALEDLTELLEEHLQLYTDPSINSNDTAQLMFTSGTTGDPKGVVLTHRNLISNVMACRELVPVDSDSRLLSLLPLSHMMEQTGGLLVPLSRGASVVFPTSRQPRILFSTMQRDRITNLVIVPQALELLMSGIEREVRAKGKEKQWQFMLRVAPLLPIPLRRWLFREVHRQFGGHLKYLISGGAYLNPVVEQKWAALGITILQGYGATEASPVISTNTFKHHRLGSVGKPLPGMALRLAADGEILVQGDNVTPGYWQNPAATDAAFTGGWYQTGDLGYLDPQGFLYLKGRKKDLIVLDNGQNVYPEDLETLLNQQSAVKDSVVLGLPNERDMVRVHAVLLMDEGGDAAQSVSSVNRLVSDHQRIRGFTVWPEEDFPRTHTMKIRKPLVLDYLTDRHPGEEKDPDAPEDPDSPSETRPPPSPAKPPPPANRLHQLVAAQCGISLNRLTPDHQLEADLSLDSLGRVELLSSIEDQLGVYIDEQSIGPATTLGQLETLITAGHPGPRLSFPTWGQAWWCRVARASLQWTLVFPLMHFFYRVDVQGQERLTGLRGPVLFAANHNIKMDNPLIIMAMPLGWRWRLSVAAAADDIFGHRVWRVAAPLLGNGFPFSREGAVRPSLEHLGRLMDQGWSVLIYPEGRNSYGEMDSFKPGAGMVAVESHSAIVPLRVRLSKAGWWDGANPPARGRVEIRFGEALTFPRRIDYRQATERIEAAVRAL
jgi:long-chain acyl-CoA synthetase